MALSALQGLTGVFLQLARGRCRRARKPHCRSRRSPSGTIAQVHWLLAGRIGQSGYGDGLHREHHPGRITASKERYRERLCR